jgi:hypothetical protein
MRLSEWWELLTSEKRGEIDRRAGVLDPNRDLGYPCHGRRPGSPKESGGPLAAGNVRRSGSQTGSTG